LAGNFIQQLAMAQCFATRKKVPRHQMCVHGLFASPFFIARIFTIGPTVATEPKARSFRHIVTGNIQNPGNGCQRSGQGQKGVGLMMLDFPDLRQELETRVRARTGGRLRKLDIQLSPEGVVLHGESTTFHVKQLAQHGVRELLPNVQLRNDIVVN
jgi:hypothetical protein